MIESLFPFILILPLYLCGSIPCAFILVKLVSGRDIRSLGSKNVGATNALRTEGKLIGCITLICDLIKTMIPLLIIKYYYDPSLLMLYMGALIIILGHIFPVWLNFKGGKGVSTFAAALVVIEPFIGGICIMLWITILMLSKVVSLSSISTLILCIIISLFYYYDSNPLAGYTVSLTALLIIIKHSSNIKRLMRAEEKTL